MNEAAPLAELAQSFNGQILLRSFLAVIFFLLAAAPIAGLWILRRKKDFWFKLFLVVLFVPIFGAGLFFGISAHRYYLNQNMVEGGASVSQTGGVLEKYTVRTGKFGEARKFEYKINGEKYDVWPDDLLNEFVSGETITIFYIEIWDTDSFKINKHKSVIINFER